MRHGRNKGKSSRNRGQVKLFKLKATVDKNRKGFAFLVFENREYDDAFVRPEDAERLFPGDRVEVTIDPHGRGRIVDLKVLAHRFRETVGRFTPHPMGPVRGGWVVYERKRSREEIFVPHPVREVNPNDWVRAKLHFHERGPFHVTAEIVEIYGQELPPSADIGMVAAEYNLIEEHSEAAEKEARSFRLTEHEMRGRNDLRDIPFITIDDETARDFDDAIYVERSENGFSLWVAIADVSHYVKEGTALDREARSRGTSVYFPERAFHMLPRALSENLCSLRPNEPRLAQVARIEFDSHFKLRNTRLFEAVIESRRRATYNEIQKERDENKDNSGWEYAPHFELFEALKKKRSARGSIDFELPEAKVLVEPTGEVISISHRPRLDAHRLIEEFMILANEAVTEWMMKRKWPFVYRVHEEPAQESLEKFQALVATVGVKVMLRDGVNSPKLLSEVVRRLEGHPAQSLLNMALLRSMKQAVYSSTHVIHYGLASPGYTHFTSPIRRYPDLVVHRLIRHVLNIKQKTEKPLNPNTRGKLEKELAEICEHCSYRERLAADAERESIKLKQVRLMRKHLGDEFDAKIVGMAESGIFAQVSDPYAEGMISQESMTDDFYQFNEERMVFSGRRKKRTFKIGDLVRIRVIKADIDRRQIDFSLI